FLDVFLLHCLLADSPPDTPGEIRELAQNQHLTAARGREPGLELLRRGSPVKLLDWGLEIIEQLQPIADALDELQGTDAHAQAVAHARSTLRQPELLPSARVLQAMSAQHDDSFIAFVRGQSALTHQHLLGLPWRDELQQRFEAAAAASVAAQRAIEAADTMPFEIYRQEYVSAERLGRPRQPAAGQNRVLAL